MAGDENVEQRAVEPVRRVDDLIDLQLGLDVEIVADVARLEVEIDQADLRVLRRLAFGEQHRGFHRQRRISDAAGARQERQHRRTAQRGNRGGRLSVDAGDDFEDVGRQIDLARPVGVAVVDELLVVGRRDFAADENEEHVAAITADGRDQLGEIFRLRRRRDDEDIGPRPERRLRAPRDVLERLDAGKARQRRLQPLLDLLEPRRDRPRPPVDRRSCARVPQFQGADEDMYSPVIVVVMGAMEIFAYLKRPPRK